MDYKIKDADSGKSIISQSLKGHFGDNKTLCVVLPLGRLVLAHHSSSLKFGSYRKVYDHMTKVR